MRELEYVVSLRLSKYLVTNYTFLTPDMGFRQCRRAHIRSGRKRIGYWGCGVDTDLFDPAKYVAESQRLKSSYRLEEKFVCLYHGVLGSNRGLDKAIEAMAQIAHKDEDIVLFLLGGGPERTRLQELVAGFCLEDRVFIRGPVPITEVPQHIQMADVCLVPLPDHSDWKDQQPLKLAEYLAMEKDVIATDIPAHARLVSSIPTVTLLPDNQPHTIASALIAAHRDSCMHRSHVACTRLPSPGRALAASTLSWRTIAADLASYLVGIARHS
jgi:glycosyltransferase involved in cell wall biosynthesis